MHCFTFNFWQPMPKSARMKIRPVIVHGRKRWRLDVEWMKCLILIFIAGFVCTVIGCSTRQQPSNTSIQSAIPSHADIQSKIADERWQAVEQRTDEHRWTRAK